MSTASTGRYQSRLLNFLLDKSGQLSDRMGQAVRQVKTATIWSIQLLIYPVYAMFQTGRLAGKQIHRAANQQLRRLQGSSKSDEGRSSRTVVAPPAEQQPRAIASENVDPELPLPRVSDRTDRFPFRAFHQLIDWMETGTVAVKVNLFQESKLVEHDLPATAKTSHPEKQEVKHISADRAEDSSWLQAVDRTVAQLEAGQFPQWQGVANNVATKTRSLWLPVKDWYMWSGDDILDLNDDDLTRDLWAEPIAQTPAKTKLPANLANLSALAGQLPGQVLPELVQKSEAAIRTKIAEWFGKVSAIVHRTTANDFANQIKGDRPSTIAVNPVNPPATVPEPKAFAAMAAELSVVPELKHKPTDNLVDRGWEYLRVNAANMTENLAIAPWAKSDQSLTQAEVATTKIQKVSQNLDRVSSKGFSFLSAEALTTSDRAIGAIGVKKNPTNQTIINQNTKVADLTFTDASPTGMGEPETGRDYIEAKVVSTGYIKHPLQILLEQIDWMMLKAEKMAVNLIEWFQYVKKRLFD